MDFKIARESVNWIFLEHGKKKLASSSVYGKRADQETVIFSRRHSSTDLFA
jgi:hypothetical protein